MPLDRRDFIKTAALAAAATSTLSVARAANVKGSDTIKVGLVGCGGRGSGAAVQALRADPGTVLWSMGDTFNDRLAGSKSGIEGEMSDKAKEKVQVTDARKFYGIDAYKAVIDSGIDMVILTTYPNFRPTHINYALEKGKHIFAEKPVAVDSTGIRSVLAAGELAKKKNLALQIGFCWRYHPAMREAFAAIHSGLIGDITSVYTNYLTGTLPRNPRKPEWSDLEFQMRNWWHFPWLSGDHIVEQAVHSVDRLSWAMGDKTPTKIHCLGGRQARTGPESGSAYDHFAAIYEYDAPGGVIRAHHGCRQISDCPSDNTDYIYGTKGKATVNGWSPKTMKLHDYSGKELWAYKGDPDDMYQVEHNELFKSIRDGKPINDCPKAPNSVLMAIAARMAAYSGQTLTWDQALNSKENLQPEKIAFDVKPPDHAVAIPGKYKLM